MRLSTIAVLPLLAVAGTALASTGVNPTSASDCDDAVAPIESDSYGDIEYSTVLDPNLSMGANINGGVRFGAHISNRAAEISGYKFTAAGEDGNTASETITITYNQLAAVLGLFVGACCFAGFATARARQAHRHRMVTFSPDTGKTRRAIANHITRARVNTWHAGDLQKLELDRV